MAKKKITPRQKMINLMYVVLMAMLAMNVSSDVLKGFSLVDEGLNRTKDNSSVQNEAIYATLEDAMKQNPEKTRVWYQKAMHVKAATDSLYDFAEQLKVDIVREADGKDGDVHNIKSRDNLEAATQSLRLPSTATGRRCFASSTTLCSDAS